MRKKVLILSLGSGDMFRNIPMELKHELEKRKNKTDQNGDSDCKQLDNQLYKLLDDFVKNQTYPYFRVNYFSSHDRAGNVETAQMYLKESEYVALPICQIFKPDYVYIVGTAKTEWASFYTRFCEKEKGDHGVESISDAHKRNIIRLYHIQNENGILTKKEELGKLESEINEIFKNISIPINGDTHADNEDSVRQNSVSPRVVLIHYGVDEEQLRTNYEIMSKMWEDLEKEKSAEDEKNPYYEVAFDITHSFRSLPLYNLMILNYHKHINNMKIEIKHVFYGMVDIKTEGKEYLTEYCERCGIDFESKKSVNSSYAPLVDLKNLVDVLELTEGVNEFKNTGSLVSLLENLRKHPEYNNLARALEDFEWAMQLNDFSQIDRTLFILKKEFKTNGHDNPRGMKRYADLKVMIQKVLESDFPQSFKDPEPISFPASDTQRKNRGSFTDYKQILEQLSGDDSELKKCIDKAYLQYSIAKWNERHHRYGITIATAIETFKSYFAILYFGRKIRFESDFNDKDSRAAAEAAFLEMLKKNEYKGTYSNILNRINANYHNAKNIRNTFAHNLVKNKMSVVGETKLESIQNKIRVFMSILDQLVFEFKKNETMLDEFQGKINPISGKMRIVITKKRNNEAFYDLLKNKKEVEYDVFRLESRVVNFILQNNEMNTYSPYLLADYLNKREELNLYSTPVQIILDDSKGDINQSLTKKEINEISSILPHIMQKKEIAIFALSDLGRQFPKEKVDQNTLDENEKKREKTKEFKESFKKIEAIGLVEIVKQKNKKTQVVQRSKINKNDIKSKSK